MNHYRNPGRRGFTLIELSMILATVATIAAIAIPRYAAAIRHYQLDTAARQLAADIALAKSRANFGSSAVTVTFDTTSNSYQIVGMPALDGRTGWYTVSLAADPYKVSISSVAFGNGTQLVFDGYGTAAASGSVVLTNGSSQRTITVDPTSGNVSVQ